MHLRHTSSLFPGIPRIYALQNRCDLLGSHSIHPSRGLKPGRSDAVPTVLISCKNIFLPPFTASSWSIKHAIPSRHMCKPEKAFVGSKQTANAAVLTQRTSTIAPITRAIARSWSSYCDGQGKSGCTRSTFFQMAVPNAYRSIHWYNIHLMTYLSIADPWVVLCPSLDLILRSYVPQMLIPCSGTALFYADIVVHIRKRAFVEPRATSKVMGISVSLRTVLSALKPALFLDTRHKSYLDAVRT
ncbi:hypothetical protein C8R46DRAFT_1186590 [Mycena filopes]|nr:hypothetical protein C8R46DRAFT_1186590 [Mycena filopes]